MLENNGQPVFPDEEMVSLAHVKRLIQGLWQEVYARRVWLIVGNLLFLIGVGSYTKLSYKPIYASAVDIMPDMSNKSAVNLGQLGSLAALAGINIGESGGSVVLYDKLLTSETVIEPVIYKKYKFPQLKDSVNLFQVFNIKPDPALPPDIAKRKAFTDVYGMLVGQMIKTNIDRTTLIFTISVWTFEPHLAVAINNALIESLDNYLRTKRKSAIKEQVHYLTVRERQIRDSLTISENQLMRFKEQNRVAFDPKLALTQARLARNIEVFQTIFTEVVKQKELIKIAEIQDSPVLNVKEEAKINYAPFNAPGVISKVIKTAFVSGFLSVLGVLIYNRVHKFFKKNT